MAVHEVNFEGWGWREISEGSKLLELFFDDKMSRAFHAIFEQDPNNLTLGFNDSSGYVWLQDENYNIAMVSKGRLDIYFTDSETGEEGFIEDFDTKTRKRVKKEYGLEDTNIGN